MAKKYTVSYEQDEEGWWVASVSGIAGVHTQGRSIETAKTRIAEAMTAALGEGKAFELEHDYKVKVKGLRASLGRIEKARAVAEREQTKAAALTRQVARDLAATMSVRDAGAVLGISHQRVQQLLQEK
ncbi:MAG: type II toxin-antitoxin system HicB family antitoxin [Gaiellales bacterium]